MLRDVVKPLVEDIRQRSHRPLPLVVEPVDQPYPHWLPKHPKPLGNRLGDERRNRPHKRRAPAAITIFMHS